MAESTSKSRDTRKRPVKPLQKRALETRVELEMGFVERG
jgi:hypothetical protein